MTPAAVGRLKYTPRLVEALVSDDEEVASKTPIGA